MTGLLPAVIMGIRRRLPIGTIIIIMTMTMVVAIMMMARPFRHSHLLLPGNIITETGAAITTVTAIAVVAPITGTTAMGVVIMADNQYVTRRGIKMNDAEVASRASSFHADITDSRQLFRSCFITFLALLSLWMPFYNGFSYTTCLFPITLSGSALGHYVLWLFARKTHGARWWAYMSVVAALNAAFIVVLYIRCAGK